MSIANFKVYIHKLSDDAFFGFFVLFFFGGDALDAPNPSKATPKRIIKKATIIIYFFLLLFGFYIIVPY